jgi:glycosyltransferase involved in cell wall biosynthesis
MRLTVIVLTFNEELHLERCLASVRGVASDILVVDSYSGDNTVDIAKAQGARVLQRSWDNHANQLNWAIDQLSPDTDWVFRLDADEVASPELINALQSYLPEAPLSVSGIRCNREMIFQGRRVGYGGVFPSETLRIFRYGQGRCEDRWMDEQIIVSNLTVKVNGEILDHNLRPLSFWVDKHNKYASSEALEVLNQRYALLQKAKSVGALGGGAISMRRILKDRLYGVLPFGLRAFAYFIYRYVFRLGFLDGQSGFMFHFLQGFWYRYLVDAKVLEVERYAKVRRCDVSEAVRDVLGIKI